MASKTILFIHSSITLLVLFTILFISNALPLSPSEGNMACPPSKTQRLVYHNETQKCYKEKSKGPCPENMILYRVDKNSVFGECDCTESGFVPWVYHIESDKCYKTYQQSYCSTGEWLVFDQDLNPVCQPNSCMNELTESNEDNPIVSYKGSCVRVNQNSDLCPNPQSEMIKFLPEKACKETETCVSEVIPTCVSTLSEHSLAKTSQLKCKPGTRRNIRGQCRKTLISQSEFDP